MKTQRTPDGITWEGLPSLFRELVPPQSDARFGDSAQTQTFCAPAAFWRKLAQSLRDPAVLALWQPYVGKGIENVGEGRLNFGTPETTDLESFIAEAAPGFGDLLRESVREPLLLSDTAESEIAIARLLLMNGATAVIRVDAHQATLQDCFFSRPARECPADASDALSRRRAVGRAMVMRHAGFDGVAMRLVLSDTNTIQTSASSRCDLEAAHSQTPFCNPTRWGFDVTRGRLPWAGKPSSHDDASNFPFARRWAASTREPLGTDVDSHDFAPSRPDAAACLPELDAAIAQLDALDRYRETQTPPTIAALQLAAYRVATALGYCRLFGVRPDVAAESSLPIRLLPLICRELTHRLTRWSAADLLCDDGSSSLWADDDYLAGLFESRMEAWAVFTEIDHAAGNTFIGLDATDPIDADTFDDLLAATESFDVLLQSREHDLLAAAPRLIANCRTLLAPRYRECAPWWLCESLSPLAK